MNYYRESLESLIAYFNTNKDTGLSQSDINILSQRYGPNTLPSSPRPTWLKVFVSQFYSPLIYLLIFAAIIIFIFGNDQLDAFIIIGVLLFNSIIGTIQEGKTYDILYKLGHLVQSSCVVIRDGNRIVINSTQLVPGDIIELQEGDLVPADARIIDATNLTTNESIITGESVPVKKYHNQLDNNKLINIPIHDQTNMLFKGTSIVIGITRALVVATGQSTYIGSIHHTIQGIDAEMPLKQELDTLAHWILVFIISMCCSLLILGIMMGKPFNELLVMLTALFICVVPEGLPVVLTLVLVTGAYRMAQSRILVKRMQAVEALGRATILLIDKTGTLTRNEMMVSHVYADGLSWKVTGNGYQPLGTITTDHQEKLSHNNPVLRKLATAGGLLSHAQLHYNKETDQFTLKGDPTDAALLVFTQKMGFTRESLVTSHTLLHEIPFDSHTQYHAGFYTDSIVSLSSGKTSTTGVCYCIGSSEVILKHCYKNQSDIPQEITHELERLLSSGLRVIVIAEHIFDTSAIPSDNSPLFFEKLLDQEFTFLGILALNDAIRSDVAQMVKQVRNAGIRVIMITGDHQTTAAYVARTVGILQENDILIDGSQLQTIDNAQLAQQFSSTTVYSRATPEQKLRIVRYAQQQGEIVAMTGDGVNDAPSLVAADLGIAMGNIGTEVAKEAADMILLDDSFANIMEAIKQGRHIFYTLRRVILYFFITNMGEILIVLFALTTSYPLPLTAAQILWLNLITDGFLDVALSMEPQEQDVLGKKIWLGHQLRLIDSTTFIKMLYLSIPMAGLSLLIFSWYLYDIALARTMVLITMAMFQWFNAWNCRSETKSIFSLGLLTNKWLIGATSFVLFLQMLILYTPFMRVIFKTVPLSLAQWGLIILISSSIIALEELRKFFTRT